MSTANLQGISAAGREVADYAAKEEKARVEAAKYMAGACEGLPNVPANMFTAAALIRELRGQIAKSEKAIASAIEDVETTSKLITEKCHAIASVETLDGVQIAYNKLVSEKMRLFDELADLRRRSNDTLIDAGYVAVPGIAGYHVADTPLLRAAEALVVMLSNKRMEKEAYLRSRSWIMQSGGTWRKDGSGSTLTDTAVRIEAINAAKPLSMIAGLVKPQITETKPFVVPESEITNSAIDAIGERVNAGIQSHQMVEPSPANEPVANPARAVWANGYAEPKPVATHAFKASWNPEENEFNPPVEASSQVRIDNDNDGRVVEIHDNAHAVPIPITH